ncbi:MAG: hypothetical protein AB7G12_03755 [Thermoanaerobaculia bacterium]
MRTGSGAAWIVASALLATGGVAFAQQTLGGCRVLPNDNVWNTPVTELPVAANSTAIIAFIGGSGTLHPDFGTVWEGAPIGIPFVVVPDGQSPLPIDFDSLGGWPEESDPGPYPIPSNPPIEGGDDAGNTGDRHVLVVRQQSCILYELYHSWREGENGCTVPGSPPGWCGLSGAVYDLASNALRPDDWTSADAAGLPILPGLVTYDEVASGEIRHALRFTVEVSRESHVWPARHDAGSSTNASAPPMGLRLRLNAGFDLSGFTPRVRTILRALKTYGMIVADNGTDWYLSGAPDPRWDDDELVSQLATVPGSAFEVVDVTSLIVDPDSGETPHLFSDGFESGGLLHWSSALP